MSALKPQTVNVTAMLKWLARGLSVASVVTLLLFFIGEGFEPGGLRLSEWALMAFFPLGVIAGRRIRFARSSLSGIPPGCGAQQVNSYPT